MVIISDGTITFKFAKAKVPFIMVTMVTSSFYFGTEGEKSRQRRTEGKSKKYYL
jgi:hypothetical protein